MGFEKKLKINPGARALIFDLDGTLADTMPVQFWVFKNILRKYGIDFTPILLSAVAGLPAVETIQKLNDYCSTAMDSQEVASLKEREYEKVLYKIKPVEPVVALAKDYYGKLPMAVGTGGYKRLAWKSLEVLGLDKYFEILVSAEDVKHPKPHPDTFLKCAELMSVKPEVCHVFEDGNLGIKAAKEAGMFATMVTDYYDVTIGKEV